MTVVEAVDGHKVRSLACTSVRMFSMFKRIRYRTPRTRRSPPTVSVRTSATRTCAASSTREDQRVDPVLLAGLRIEDESHLGDVDLALHPGLTIEGPHRGVLGPEPAPLDR